MAVAGVCKLGYRVKLTLLKHRSRYKFGSLPTLYEGEVIVSLCTLAKQVALGGAAS